MLRFELRHYMYLPPIFKPRIMSPLNRGSGLFVPVPRGFRLRQAYAVTSRRRAAPPPGYHISPLAGALISAGIRPQGIPYKLPFGEFFEVPISYFVFRLSYF